MTNEKSITIDADAARRMSLNAERTHPRYDAVLPTNSGEATQTLNPITGRPYAFYESGIPFMSESEIVRVESMLKKRYSSSDIFTYEKRSFLIENPGFIDKFIGKPRTNDAIELQKALGRMEVREGNLHDYIYGQFLDEVERLADVYAENPALTLESITDVNGLNSALCSIEWQRRPKKDFGDFLYEKDNILELIELPEFSKPNHPKEMLKFFGPKHEFRPFQ